MDCKKLCIISIVALVISWLMFGACFIFVNLITILFPLYIALSLTSLILMIIARVNFPKDKFAKILMWVYIALIIVTIIVFVFAFMNFFKDSFYKIIQAR